MDYKTVFKCLLAMKNCSPNFEDIQGLMLEEFESSEDLRNDERQLLLSSLERWESGDRTNAIDEMERVLMIKDGYRKTLADCIANTLMKGRPAEDY
ncbi:MAG: hypothetical protein EHM12_13320 [Dehalococcoidia bacterium]|nr:MAG: hypothetical protein EHM12_13320 [Dehalococcoidia bacterium]